MHAVCYASAFRKSACSACCSYNYHHTTSLVLYGDEPCHECIDDRPATFREASQLPLCRSGKPVAGQPPSSPSTQTHAFEGPNRSRLGLVVVNLSAQEEACVHKIFFCATATSPIIAASHRQIAKQFCCMLYLNI